MPTEQEVKEQLQAAIFEILANQFDCGSDKLWYGSGLGISELEGTAAKATIENSFIKLEVNKRVYRVCIELEDITPESE